MSSAQPPKKTPLHIPRSGAGRRGHLLALALWGSASVTPAALALEPAVDEPAPIATAEEEPIALYGAPPVAEYGMPPEPVMIALYGIAPDPTPPVPPPVPTPADPSSLAPFQGTWTTPDGLSLEVEAVYYEWDAPGQSERGQVSLVRQNLLGDGSTLYQILRFERYINGVPAPDLQEAWVVSEDKTSMQVGNKTLKAAPKK